MSMSIEEVEKIAGLIDAALSGKSVNDALEGGSQNPLAISGDIAAIVNTGRPQKLSATPDLSGTVLPLCLIPNSASKSAPPFN